MQRLVAVLAALACVLVGCASSAADPTGRTATVPVEQTTSGRLTSPPAPLTLADVARLPDGSARRAVMQLMFWAQWGNLPAVADAYDSRIVRALGRTNVLGAYDLIRADLVTFKPRVITQRGSGAAQFVSIELATTGGLPSRESFLLRRRKTAWRVVYDTLLEGAIEAFVTARQAPGDDTPSLSARRRGARTAQRYRDRSYSLVSERGIIDASRRNRGETSSAPGAAQPSG